MSTVAQKYIIEAYFKGLPKQSDLKIVEESLPAIKDGGYLINAVILDSIPSVRRVYYL